jgi:DNA repair protein RecO (recombination protein O)
MRSFKTEGIVIKRKNYAEADRILTVFTKHHGKLQIKASGIRRVPSRRSAHVELLNHAALTLYRGAMFPTLTEAQTIDSFSPIKTDLNKVSFAYHICELVDGLCPEGQESSTVFDLLHKTLEQLALYEALGEEKITELIHSFEIELLTMLGYWDTSKKYAYDFDTRNFIEGIMERKLKSHKFFNKLQ